MCHFSPCCANPESIASLETKSNAPIPSTDKTVLSGLRSVRAYMASDPKKVIVSQKKPSPKKVAPPSKNSWYRPGFQTICLHFPTNTTNRATNSVLSLRLLAARLCQDSAIVVGNMGAQGTVAMQLGHERDVDCHFRSSTVRQTIRQNPQPTFVTSGATVT